MYVEGSLRTRKWQGQDGQDRYTTEIVASEMQMLDSRGGSAGNYDSDSMQQNAPQNQPSQPSQQANQQKEAPAASDSGFNSFDDDIPF